MYHVSNVMAGTGLILHKPSHAHLAMLLQQIDHGASQACHLTREKAECMAVGGQPPRAPHPARRQACTQTSLGHVQGSSRSSAA